MKNTFLLYLVFLPEVFFVIYSFIISFNLKIKLNNFLYQEYIEEYINHKSINKNNKLTPFSESRYDNNVQFICLLLIIFLMIIYPISIFLIYGCKSDENRKTDDISLIYMDENEDSVNFSNINYDKYSTELVGYNSQQSNITSMDQKTKTPKNKKKREVLIKHHQNEAFLLFDNITVMDRIAQFS